MTAETKARFAWTQPTPVGPITLVEQGDALIEARFGSDAGGAQREQTPLLVQAFAQLQQYFRGERRAFDLPLSPRGTVFQRKCWDALCLIPYGETRSYAAQAQLIGNPRACRAVGMANHHNPLPIFIPCHRVVGKNGALTGYAGGLSIKQALLNLEQNAKG